MVASVEHDYRLLVADDDPGFRETVQDMLSPHFETIAVESGEQAITIVEQRVVHLVLMDFHMHALNGMEAVRIVKSIRAELPCILITSDPSDSLRREAAEARAYKVLRKPPSRDLLLTTIGSALRESYESGHTGEHTELGL